MACVRQNRIKKKTVTEDMEGHYVIMKGSIQQVDVTVVNIYVLHIGKPKYIQ